jgi:hypothetical protein
MTKQKEIKPVDKQSLVNTGLNAIQTYFLINPKDVKDNVTLNHLMQKAKLGLQFEKEMNLNKRATEMMSFRVMKLTTTDKAQLKEYIKKTMPQYSP